MFANSTRLTPINGALIAVTFACISLSNSVWSQDVSEAVTNERLLACNAITDATEKLACFNSVVNDLGVVSEAPVATSPPIEPTEMPQRPTNSAASESTAATAAAITVAKPDPEPKAAAVEKQSPPATTPRPATEPEDSIDLAEQYFGLGQSEKLETSSAVRETLDNMDSISATIVDVWPTTDRRFEVRLDNGQVWRETTRTRVRTPNVGSAVRISRASLGSYRMRINNNNRQAGVRRTK